MKVMTGNFKNHLAKFVEISDEDFSTICSYFEILDVDKKQNLLIEGKICKKNYFVNQGCLRLFFVNDKGVEQTIQFALENWWISDYLSFSNQSPSEFYIQTVEKSQIITLDFESQQKLLEEFPQMERYFRLVHQRAHAASQFRIRNLYSHTREEIYYNFLSNYPEFVQRIPQYLLASFLGFTPEYLSEIRNKKRS